MRHMRVVVNDVLSNWPLLWILCISSIVNSCTLSKIPKSDYNVEYDEIAFFTEDNKPDEYSDANPYSYSYMETTTEMDKGYNWAKDKNEEKIREKAVLYRFNGVILLEPIVTTNENTGHKYLYQRFLPINYDPQKYKAPLTDYQKALKNNQTSENK